MNYNVRTQKVYTFPDRELYGEYCEIGLLELRLGIVNGEINEELCILDENDRAYCFNKYGVLENCPDFYLTSISNKLLTKLLKAQMELRKNENDGNI